MSGEAFALRVARTDDAPALGFLHAACWQESYADIMPERILATSTVESRTDFWCKVLDPATAFATCVVIAERRGEPIGFGACGPQRTAQLAADGYDGEIGALYVRRFAQGRGVGSALFSRLARDLEERGSHGLALWVLRENLRARRFYERYGGARSGRATSAAQAGVFRKLPTAGAASQPSASVS